MEVYTLPLAPGYVKHWKTWEGVRELLQNALDEQSRDPACKVAYGWDERLLTISSSGRTLPRSSLLLGNTTKADSHNQRGQFGEGYKLALLVLEREGKTILIRNGDEIWIPRIEHEERYQSDVLNIYVYEAGQTYDGVAFEIDGVSEEEWRDIRYNIHPIADRDEILYEPEQMGRIYVGGLFVARMPEFERGYAFAANTMKLDRDRCMVNGFDLSYITSRLWSAREVEDDLVVEMILEKKPDVAYVESHAGLTSPVVHRVHTYFQTTHGEDAIPVATQAEVERATAAGVKWILVPTVLKTLLGKVRSYFIPTKDSPVARLRKFVTRYQYNLNQDMRDELDDLIKTMEGTK